MAINKVIYQGQTLVDLTNDTITANDLAKGVTAHAANGELITGTMTGGEGGIDTSDATATKSEIFLNKTAYVNGEKVIGEFTIDSELTEQDEIIIQIENALNDKIDAYDNGYADGKQTEYDAFWDAYQLNGTRTIYRYAFSGAGWNEETFKPKYVIRPSAGSTPAQNMFCYFSTNQISGKYLPIVDFTELSKMIDLSKATGCTSIFDNARIKNLTVDLSSATNLTRAFALGNGGDLDNITIKVTDKCTTFNATFGYTNTLKTLTFTEDSVIGANLSLSACPLTHDSIISVVNALKDYSGTTTARTCTLGTTNLAKLTDAEKAIATEKGWTLA